MGCWLKHRLGERSSQAAIGGFILLGAAVLDGTIPDWHAAVKPAAALLIAFLFNESPGNSPTSVEPSLTTKPSP